MIRHNYGVEGMSLLQKITAPFKRSSEAKDPLIAAAEADIARANKNDQDAIFHDRSKSPVEDKNRQIDRALFLQ